MSKLVARLDRALAWAAPLILGFALAYVWSVAPGALATTATVSAVAAGLIAWAVFDYREAARRLSWLAQVRGYAAQTDDALVEQGRMIAALLTLHTPWYRDADRVRLRYAVRGAHWPAAIPPGHECVDELVWTIPYGWTKCDLTLARHVVVVCDHCEQPWPCASALIADPDLTPEVGSTPQPVEEPADAGAASPLALAVAALAIVTALAASVVVAPGARVDGRGVVAAVLATALVLTVGARRERRAAR